MLKYRKYIVFILLIQLVRYAVYQLRLRMSMFALFVVKWFSNVLGENPEIMIRMLRA